MTRSSRLWLSLHLGPGLAWIALLASRAPTGSGHGATGSQVFVMLYDLSLADEMALDRWEGGDLGIYVKLRVRVDTLDGEILAWMYVLDGYEGGLPSARYLGIIADAAEAAGAPHDYVADLRARPCSSIGP